MEARQLNQQQHQQPDHQPPNLNIVQKSSYEPGGLGIRFVARLLDGIIVSIISLPLTIGFGIAVASMAPKFAANPLFAAITQGLSLGITLAYYGLFYTKSGASPGKKLFNLKVENIQNGANPGWGSVALRETIGVMLSAVLLGIGFLMAAFNKEKRGLHDMIGGTRVVKKV